MTKGRAWTEPHADGFRARAKVDGKKKTISGGHATRESADLFRDAWNSDLELAVIARGTG